MNLEQFQQLLLQKQKEIEQAMRRTLPVKVGRIAKDHFQEGFQQGGFQDNGTQAWQRKKRPDKYGPLMSSRQNLYGSYTTTQTTTESPSEHQFPTPRYTTREGKSSSRHA